MIYTKLTKLAMKIAFEAHKEQVDKITKELNKATYVESLFVLNSKK